MPTDATYRAQKDKLQAELEKLDHIKAYLPKKLFECLSGLITAVDYKDGTLVRSNFHLFLETYRDYIQEILSSPPLTNDFREVLAKTWEVMRSLPLEENYDYVGKKIESNLNDHLETLQSLHEGVERLRKTGYGIDEQLADRLSREIEQLRNMKESVLRDWPWSTEELPPLNKEMVMKARSQKGEPVQDIIRRLGGDPSTR
jgi:hypothetical protein